MEQDDYIEKDDPDPLPITCGVCHDPHGSDFDANLRAPIDVASVDNLCVTCHARRGTPPSSHGPHAAQGLLVLGTNVGWIPPNFQYDTATIIGTHGTTANPRLCATCHVPKFTVTDEETGDFLLESVGHRFQAIVCLDAQGLPTEGPCAISERDFASCSGSGCHGSADVARSVFQVTKNRINGLLDALWLDANNDSVIDPPPTDTGLLPQVVALGDTSQLDVTDDVVTVAEGALWNAQLSYTADRPYFGDGQAFGIHFSAHKASGEGVHNPFLLEALLASSIDAVKAEYGIMAPLPVSTRVQAIPPPGLATR